MLGDLEMDKYWYYTSSALIKLANFFLSFLGKCDCYICIYYRKSFHSHWYNKKIKVNKMPICYSLLLMHGVRVVNLFIFFCVVILYVSTFWVPCCVVRYDFHIKKRCSVGRRYLHLFVGGIMSYAICVCFRIVVSNTYCVVFFVVLCTLYCQFLWIFYLWSSLRFSLTFIS